MMHIDILCVGKIKEKFYTDAALEYRKRLNAYAKVDITEVKDEPTKEEDTDAMRDRILTAEADRIRKYLNAKAYTIALAVEGRQMTSPEFAAMLDRKASEGYGAIQFLIGGSLGLEEKLKKEADERISFSEMTFPHQLMRVILLEQIYRGYRILQGAPYHK